MANPILSRVDLNVGIRPMTADGVVKKSSLLLGVSAATGIAYFFILALSGLSRIASMSFFVSMIAAMIAAMGIGIYAAMKPEKAKVVAVPYAMIEGILIGSISIMAYRFSPSLPVVALSATFVTAAVMLGLYRTGIIKVTQKFRSVVYSAGMAIFIVYAVQWVLSLAFGSSLPYLFDGGIVAIGFSLFAVTIASFFLVLDFNNVDRGIEARVSEEYEWVYSMAILATLVWMYVEFIRLISYFND